MHYELTYHQNLDFAGDGRYPNNYKTVIEFSTREEALKKYLELVDQKEAGANVKNISLTKVQRILIASV